jgi:hypothetical protein
MTAVCREKQQTIPPVLFEIDLEYKVCEFRIFNVQTNIFNVPFYRTC